MDISFDSFYEKEFGILYKYLEFSQDGKIFRVDIDLDELINLEANFLVKDNLITIPARIIDDRSLSILFTPEVIQVGKHKFELVAFYKDGSTKISQTCSYSIQPSLGGLYENKI